MRLNASIVNAGFVSSRRKADALIKTKNIKLNGKPVHDLSTQVSFGDTICVGEECRVVKHLLPQIIILNKPSGYVTSHNPQNNQKSIFELLDPKLKTYKVVGRLDIESEGLLILTNDGQLANRLAHPSFAHTKRYEVMLDKPITKDIIINLTKPMVINAKHIKAKSVKQVNNKCLEIVLTEGINRQIRKMAGQVGCGVIRLRRLSVGPIELNDLPIGQYKKLKYDSIKGL